MYQKKYAWAKKPEPIGEKEITVEYQADLVILGAGHAGTCAARAAAENGNKVIVIEQQSEKNQWILGVGEVGHINSRWQQSKGLEPVDIDEFVADWQLRTNNRSDARLIRAYAKECGPCFDWLLEMLTEEEISEIHAMLTPPSPNMPKSVNGLRAWPGTANMGIKLQNKVIKESQKKVKSLGGEFFFGTRGVELTMTGDRVTGVIAQLPDGTYGRFSGSRGVIIAAGDYSKNAEMCHDLLAETDDLVDEGDITGHGWDGSGIRMGMWAGGRLEPRSHAAMGGNYSFPGFDVVGSTAVLRVNCHGKRYSNEGFGTHILAALPGAKQPNGYLWGIFDSTILEQITYQTPCHAVFDYTNPDVVERLEGILRNGKEHMGERIMVKDKAGDVRPMYCAETISDLAKLLFESEHDQKQFVETVERYNAYCHAGKDEEFGKDPQLLWPVEKGPFYASGNLKDSHKPGGQSMKLLVTASGLLIDENQQVLDKDYEPIPGLYATGNSSGCRFGLQYTTSLPGQSISIAQTLGKVLGDSFTKI